MYFKVIEDISTKRHYSYIDYCNVFSPLSLFLWLLYIIHTNSVQFVSLIFATICKLFYLSIRITKTTNLSFNCKHYLMNWLQKHNTITTKLILWTTLWSLFDCPNISHVYSICRSIIKFNCHLFYKQPNLHHFIITISINIKFSLIINVSVVHFISLSLLIRYETNHHFFPVMHLLLNFFFDS